MDRITMPGPKQYALTLHDVSEIVAQELSISTQKRRELRSAIATFARACSRTQSEIVADARHINFLLEKAGWPRLGIGQRSWSNVQSRVRTALQIASVDIVKRRNFKLSPVWEELISPLSIGKRQDLSRFAGFCTLRDIAPSEVTDDVFQEFLRFNHEQVVQRDARERWQAARRAWNHLASMAPQFALANIPNTTEPRWRGLAWNELPPALKTEIEALTDWLVNVDAIEEPDRDQLKPVTASNYAGNLRRNVSHLVQMGVSIDNLTSLSAILDCDLIKRFFSSQAERRGLSRAELKEKGDPNMHAYIAALMAAARFVEASDELWKTLKSIGDLVRCKQWELTPKNQERIRTLCAPDVEPKYLNLPLTVSARLGAVKHPTIVEALDMQSAAALFLIKAPLRIENLSKLDLNRHIRRSSGAMPGEWLVHFDGHEVKNGSQIDFVLGDTTRVLLDRYLTVFRPVLLRKGPLSSFFVTKDGKPKGKDALRKQLQKFVWRKLGIEWHPHIVRGHAGWLELEENPGNSRSVQRLLGHTRQDTTTTHYLPQKSRAGVQAA